MVYKPNCAKKTSYWLLMDESFVHLMFGKVHEIQVWGTEFDLIYKQDSSPRYWCQQAFQGLHEALLQMFDGSKCLCKKDEKDEKDECGTMDRQVMKESITTGKISIWSSTGFINLN